MLESCECEVPTCVRVPSRRMQKKKCKVHGILITVVAICGDKDMGMNRIGIVWVSVPVCGTCGIHIYNLFAWDKVLQYL